MATQNEHTPEIRAMLKKAGLSERSEMDPEKVKRAQALADRIKAGETLSADAIRRGLKGETAGNGNGERTPADSTEARTARVAWQIAGATGDPLGGMITSGQAAAVISAIGRRGVLDALGDVSERTLVQFVHGAGRSVLSDDAKKALRELTAKATKDMPAKQARQLWGRKVAAIALAFHRVRADRSLDAPPQKRADAPTPGKANPPSKPRAAAKRRTRASKAAKARRQTSTRKESTPAAA